MLSSYPIASTPVAALPDNGSIGAITGSSIVTAETVIVFASIGVSAGTSTATSTGNVATLPNPLAGSLLGFGALSEAPLSTTDAGNFVSGVASIEGTSQVVGYTQTVIPSVASAIGTSEALAVGYEWAEGFSTGEATGTSVVSATGVAIYKSDANSVGTATVSGISSWITHSVGSSSGLAAATAIAAGVNVSVASTVGASVVSGTGVSIYHSVASSVGTATVEGVTVSPSVIASTSYTAFVEIPTLSLLWSTDSGLKDGVWASPLLSTLPEPSESLNDAYGLSKVDNLRISIADTTLNTSATTLIGETLHVTQNIVTVYADGTTNTDVYTRTYTVKSFVFVPGIVTLNCVDIENATLETLFPVNVYRVEEWPNLLASDVGKVVPEAAGIGVKLLCVLVDPALFKYAVARSPSTILNVYRGGRLVPSDEYVVSSETVASYSAVIITFSQEQKDFSGNYYVLEADCSANSSNAATELLRVLTEVGVTTNSTSFATAVTVATANYMVADIGYRTQRTASAVINDLLLILRGSLYRGDTGYEIIQDVEQIFYSTWDEALGDNVEVMGYNGADSPATVEVEYLPNVVTPDTLTHVISKSAGGYTGVKRYKVPYISDHQSADRLLDYLAKRNRYGASVNVQILNSVASLNDRIQLSSPALWTGTKDFSVRKVVHGVNKSTIIAREYNGILYTYEPQTYPEGAVVGYLPDYSKTLPLAPTSLLVDQSSTYVNTDGTTIATARGSAIPPTVNWSKLYIQATNTLTNEIYQAICSDIGGGRYGAQLSGLRPGQAHTLVSWAENAFGVQGIVSSPLAFTSAGYTTLPAAPTSVSASQGSGKVITVSWVASTTGTIVDHYDVYRSTNGSTYTKVAIATGSYADTDVYYGTNYYYKARAVDRSGNQSYDSSVASKLLAVNVDTPDLVDSGVTTDKRQSMNAYSVAYTVAPGAVSTVLLWTGLPASKGATATVSSGSVYAPIWVVSSIDNILVCAVTNLDFAPISGTAIVYYW